MFHQCEAETIPPFIKTKLETADNPVNMCCVSDPAFASAGEERQAFVRPLPGAQEVIAARTVRDTHPLGGTGRWETYPFLIKAC